MGAAALAVVLGRFLGLLFPVGADEAGFTLVARAWDPQPGSTYGTYWLDRPPLLVLVFRWADQVGGTLGIRTLAALGCAVLVVAAAATTRALLRHLGETDAAYADRAGAWCAVFVASVTASAMVDPIGAKGELLGIPLVMVSCWLTLTAVARARPDAAAMGLAAGAGLTATAALGMKQSLVAGLVFGGALLVGSMLDGRITVGHGLRLLGAAGAGAAIPVAATIWWAVAAGVRLDALWYAVAGFRTDAAAVIAAGSADAPRERGALLLGVLLASGAGLVVALLVAHAKEALGRHRTLLAACAAVIGVDVVGLLLGGSYWRSYVHTLVPGLALAAALLLSLRGRAARRMRRVAVLAAVSSAASLVVGAALIGSGAITPGEVRTGEAIGRAAAPGDTIVSYGGRPSLVLASSLPSPYPHLWSLPMRTLDPDLGQLRELLDGADAPTWLVLWVPTTAWDGLGRVLEPIVRRRYRLVGEGCWDRPVYLRDDVTRPALRPRCD